MLKPASARFFKKTSTVSIPGIFLLIMMLFIPVYLSARADAVAFEERVLVVGAVQFAVSEEVYRSMESFRRAVEESLNRLEARASSTGSGRPLNLAVFPEYTSAFPGLSYLSEEEIKVLEQDPASNRFLIGWALRMAEPEIISMWSDLARIHGYFILAGTTLILDNGGNIRNRALLFSPDGELVWTQDKVFPGAPEMKLLNLKTGKPDDTHPFEINGFRIVVTICRDTYHEEWEEILPEADLWLDIKANELPFTRTYYDEALAARLPGAPTDAGLTVSLSGSILGFSFTGPTEFLKDNGRTSEIITSTDPDEKNALMILEFR